MREWREARCWSQNLCVSMVGWLAASPIAHCSCVAESDPANQRLEHLECHIRTKTVAREARSEQRLRKDAGFGPIMQVKLNKSQDFDA